MTRESDLMVRALEASAAARIDAPPNPWVGALVLDEQGTVRGLGVTRPPGGPHAEVVALHEAGDAARGGTLVVTLEPCDHRGRTPPCTEAIIAAGIGHVVVGVRDPDAQVAGRGVARLREAGVDVTEGVMADAVAEALAPYLWQRRTGRPWVVLKVAATLDGVVAAADGSSQWITGEAARADAHRLRAESQAILVGAGTVRADDPTLTARLPGRTLEPLRVVLGTAPATARVRPCWERSGPLEDILDELGGHGVLQVLVEGGPATASAFVGAGLVNRVVWYVAPALAGARNTLGALRDLSTASIDRLRRGHLIAVERLGEDLRIEMEV